MGKLYDILSYIRRHKYTFAVCLFVVLIGFVDENSLWNRHEHKAQIRLLQSEIEKYNEMYARDTRYLQELNGNIEVLSEVARERYFMKTEDEDVFVIEK